MSVVLYTEPIYRASHRQEVEHTTCNVRINSLHVTNRYNNIHTATCSLVSHHHCKKNIFSGIHFRMIRKSSLLTVAMEMP